MSYLNYEIRAYWGADGLAPDAIGKKTITMIEQLGPLDPAMSNWELFDESTQEVVPLAEAREDMTAFVEKNLIESDWGGPVDEQGYGLIVWGAQFPTDERSPQNVSIALTAGNTWRNRATFQIGAVDLPKDYSLITYPIYKGALEVIAANWPCPWLLATLYSADEAPIDTTMEARDKNRSPFDVAWIAYLSPQLAAGLAPPSELAPERTPGGGLVLSAVEDLIDQRNPEHMRRSRMLEAIMEDRVGRDGRKAAQLPARVGPY